MILTPACIGTDLVNRREAQDGKFIPNQSEIRLFRKEIPRIIFLLKEAGLKLEWYYSFNQAFQDVWRVKDWLKEEYKKMIMELADNSELVTDESVVLLAENLEFIDWEEDVLGRRPKPSPLLSGDKFEKYVKQGMIKREFNDLKQWVIDEGIKQTDKEIMEDVRLDLSCGAGEGKFLMSGKSLFGSEFIIIPIERPEALDSFAILVPEIKERILTILNTYPARLSDEEKQIFGYK